MTPFETIHAAVLASLRANNLTVVRIADTTFGSEQDDERFARDVAANAAMALAGGDDEPVSGPWRPADQVVTHG